MSPPFVAVVLGGGAVIAEPDGRGKVVGDGDRPPGLVVLEVALGVGVPEPDDTEPADDRE
ncbi:MAG TPA: hypothetical protein VNG12_03950 [Acidimicrobiales bacterium]|nr:hypothetical protein [Acidimicrobiales bacterium]